MQNYTRPHNNRLQRARVISGRICPLTLAVDGLWCGFTRHIFQISPGLLPSVQELPIAWRISSLEPYLASFVDWVDLAGFPKSMREAIDTTVPVR
jgi:hypothetical protein